MMVGLMLTLVLAAVQDSPPVRTVDRVDLDRYVGDWFEIARYPNRFQDQCAGDVRARYARRQDGRIDVTNSCRKEDGSLNEASGVARVADPKTSAKLEVRFAPAWLSWLPSVWGDYWILGLAPDYSWAVVGSPDRQYLWILARTASLDDETYKRALEVATVNRFDASRLVRTRQRPDKDGGARPPLRDAGTPGAGGWRELSSSTI